MGTKWNIIFSCISYIFGVSCLEITNIDFKIFLNKKSSGQVMFSVPDVSATECGAMCSQRDDCFSFNVITVNNTYSCEIIDGRENAAITDDPDSDYYGK